jgi:AraC-like DNA-binding protein
MNESQQQNIEAVQRMQGYIADHLDQHLSLEQLARVGGYSPWHAARAFKKWTGRTPLAYIRALRLSRAALALRDGRDPIVDVALDFCFDSQEGFTRAFSEAFGTTPARYRKRPTPIPLFIPYRVMKGERKMLNDMEKGTQEGQSKETTMEHQSSASTVFVQVVERPARKLLLLRGKTADNYYDYCEEVGCDVWGVLCSVKEALYEPVGLWLPENLRKPGTGEYAQGVEVPASYAGEVPDGYDLMDLPACKMMVFQGPPFNDEDFEEAIGSLWEVMKRYDPVFYGFRWADGDAPRIQLEPQGERGYIEARPVRKI